MKSIFIIALGHVDEEILKTLEIGLWQIFGFTVRRLPSLPEPTYAYDEHRKQFSSALILSELVKLRPEGMIRVLGITEVDLFIPMLSFVFGHAQLNGTDAVVSLARLHQQFYHLPENKEVLLARCLKEVVHELGHTFGLIHCSDSKCAMSLSNAIQLVDFKSANICPNCSILLKQYISQLFPDKGMEKIQ